MICNAYTIKNDDYLKIIIDSGLEKLNFIKSPDNSGNIYLKYIDFPISATGNSLTSLSSKISNIYIKQQIYRNPSVKITIVNKIKILIKGKVFDSGIFEFSTWEELISFLLKDSSSNKTHISIIGMDGQKTDLSLNEMLLKKGELFGIKEIIVL